MPSLLSAFYLIVSAIWISEVYTLTHKRMLKPFFAKTFVFMRNIFGFRLDGFNDCGLDLGLQSWITLTLMQTKQTDKLTTGVRVE